MKEENDQATPKAIVMKPILLIPIIFGLVVSSQPLEAAATRIALKDGRWVFNGRLINPGSSAEGLLMNVRMVNATFEDRAKPDFDPEANTDRFISRISDYAAQGVNAFTLCLQGGMPGYEGAVNSAFEPDGRLRESYLKRVERVIRASDQHGVGIILGLFYQRQSKILKDDQTLRAGVVNTVRWVRERGFQNVMIEIANEYPHKGFAHMLIRDPVGQASLIRLAKVTAPALLVSASGYGDGKIHAEVAEAADFLLPHWNGTPVEKIPSRVAELKRFDKPIVCNEDDKTGERAVAALKASVESGCGYGLMLKDHNQTFPFHFDGAQDAPVYYAALKALTSGKPVTPPTAGTANATSCFPPPESTKVPNAGPWEFILGHRGDARNQRLAFDPGTDLDYGTKAFHHAAQTHTVTSIKTYQ